MAAGLKAKGDRLGGMPDARGKIRVRAVAAFALAACGIVPAPARAERLENQVAAFATLDKVTARISKVEAPLGETFEFGALRVTARVCYSRPPTEQPKTTAFVEVDQVDLDGGVKRIFTGWMFAESPGLNAVEHPVFDVWLTGCDKPKRSLARRERQNEPGADPNGAAAAPDDSFSAPRRRVRR